MSKTTHAWWQRGVVYQIYPRSFQDSNDDGVGDLPGILRRLDYLHWLGVDAVWISPIYPSPMADFGYDVSDYANIDLLFGTLADMDQLISAVHRLGMKIILDFVPNHSSDQHPWFQESRSSRLDPKRDWYIWQDPAPDGGPPNNWLSRFGGGSAWTWDESTGQYYLHLYLKEQPDLNWRNPAVRDAMLDALRFWFDRGVDGFRLDVFDKVMKDPAFRDNPINPAWQPGQNPADRLLQTHTKSTPDCSMFNRWLRNVADEYEDRVLIGETYLPSRKLVVHYGDGDELHLPFNFQLLNTPWDVASLRQLVETYEDALPPDAWPNWVLGNHDRSRIATRVGPRQARVAMMLLLTLRGTPTLYYGDEIGMQDVPIAADRIQDPWARLSPGLGLGRDPERTPMQWSDATNAGFCAPGVEPWLPISEDYTKVNVATQSGEPDSMLALAHHLLQLRRSLASLSVGAYHSADAPSGLFAYRRETEEERCLVVLNLTGEDRVWHLPAAYRQASLLLSTHLDRLEGDRDGALQIRPDEGLILAIN